MASDGHASEAAWQAYASTLPGKRMGVGCLLRDAAGRLLIVNPTYKPGWSIPGGVVDENESPYHACRRELFEELGVELDPGRLVCVDYVPGGDGSTENVQLLFDGGTVPPELAERFVLAEEELSEWRFEEIPRALALLRPKVGSRIRALLEASQAGCVYLEAGRPV